MSIRRQILAAATVIGISISLVSCEATTTTSSDSTHASDTTQVADTTVAPEDTIGTGLGSKDASADIVSITCGVPDEYLKWSTPVVRVTNNSSKASDYMIEISAESADGSELFDSSTAVITALAPGQSTNAEAMPFTKELPTGAICKVKTVSRTASN